MVVEGGEHVLLVVVVQNPSKRVVSEIAKGGIRLTAAGASKDSLESGRLESGSACGRCRLSKVKDDTGKWQLTKNGKSRVLRRDRKSTHKSDSIAQGALLLPL